MKGKTKRQANSAFRRAIPNAGMYGILVDDVFRD
jgi:hypothetical protein